MLHHLTSHLFHLTSHRSSAEPTLNLDLSTLAPSHFKLDRDILSFQGAVIVHIIIYICVIYIVNLIDEAVQVRAWIWAGDGRGAIEERRGEEGKQIENEEKTRVEQLYFSMAVWRYVTLCDRVTLCDSVTLCDTMCDYANILLMFSPLNSAVSVDTDTAQSFKSL